MWHYLRYVRIHDDWFEVEWCATTGHTSNIWGRGENVCFGKYYLLGSHDAISREVILYKVGPAVLHQRESYEMSRGLFHQRLLTPTACPK